MNFKNIKGGDTVTFNSYAGRGLNGPEYVIRKAKAVPMLCFTNHVVVKHTSMGTVVDESNYISHRAAK